MNRPSRPRITSVAVLAVALAALCGLRDAAAEDVFYATSGASGTDLGATPRVVTVPGSPDKAPKSAPRNDVIVRHNLEKNQRTEVLRINHSLLSFSVSPKGDRLTYLVRGRGEKGEWQICATDIDGKAIGRLTAQQFKEKANGRPLGTPVLSPDDGTILFAASISPAPRTPVVERIVTFNIKSQAFADLGPGILPSLSPDGKSILLTEVGGTPDKPAYRLAVMAADGSGRKAITDVGNLNGSFSHDGKQVAFVKIVGGASEVWTCAADGTGAKKVDAPKSTYSSPKWLSDGKRLSVVAFHKDMRPAVLETLARMKAKKGGKGKVPDKDEYDARAEGYEPRDVYVISTESPGVRHLTRLHEEAENLAFFVDGVAAALIRRAAWRQADIDMPVYVPPAGWVVAFLGTKVILRDKNGATKPLPDGRYKLAPNLIINVVNGEKVISSGGFDDDDF